MPLDYRASHVDAKRPAAFASRFWLGTYFFIFWLIGFFSLPKLLSWRATNLALSLMFVAGPAGLLSLLYFYSDLRAGRSAGRSILIALLTMLLVLACIVVGMHRL